MAERKTVKRAAKKADIDLESVEVLASKFCNSDEIATRLGFDVAQFKVRRDVAQAFEKGRNTACIELRRMMYDAASGGDRQAIVFLAKNELGYGDNPAAKDRREDVSWIVDDVGAGEGHE